MGSDPLDYMNRFAQWPNPPQFDGKWAAALGRACDELAAKDARIAALTDELERVKSELEDARIYITTEDGAKLHIRNLIRCGLRSLRRKRGVFWGSVADAYGVGSTSAHRLCRFVNLNPDTGELEPT